MLCGRTHPATVQAQLVVFHHGHAPPTTPAAILRRLDQFLNATKENDSTRTKTATVGDCERLDEDSENTDLRRESAFGITVAAKQSKFEHERELLNKMESLSNMIDLEGIAESNAKDVVSVVSSTEPGTKKELNGNLSPEFMSMPISKVSNYELEPYSGHALLEPDLNINSGDMEYSDISSCSDTEPNLDGKSSSPIEPAICANEETQPFEGVDQNVRNSVDFLLEISPSTLKEISEPCPKQDAEPQVTADETTVDVNHMNGDCNDEPPLTNADTPCGELQRVDDLKCAEDELVESTDLEIESRDKAENPEHGNGSPGICQLEINQQVLGDTLFNTDPGNPTDERKCLTSEEHVERDIWVCMSENENPIFQGKRLLKR
ncbi:hypothetical protein DNTS_021622 [Danionella cerebrum]|uniref:Uncharacterized protein n=1 Tax=Danionella cerebrum TaxID=2873325 RepID=A0A553QXQ4_9TELE|nr:hypothetical protein DNTS_021622 [Danionella translucida]